MAAPSRRTLRLALPSGATAALDVARARAAAGEGAAGIAGALRILGAEGVLRATSASAPTTLDDLPLADLHVLRVALVQEGILDEPSIDIACDNCGGPIAVAPAREVELAPFRDGELDDPSLDAPFAFDVDHAIPAVRLARGVARTVRLAPRTVSEARALHRRDPATPLALTPALVAALGIVSLGRERRASAIAAALAAAPDAAWDAVCDRWDEAHGHPRLVASVRCPGCGARNDVPAPAERELGVPTGAAEPPRRRGGPVAFPDVDTFTARVREHADVVFARKRMRGVDLVVDDDVPAVDDGGEPLLGCYTPPHTDDLHIERPPEIRLFYRTFRAEMEADPAFPLDAEIRETIEHELEHHENFLRGEDPLDDEERDAIADERRRVVGRRESARRGVRAMVADLRGFLRVAWPLLAVGAVATWLDQCR